MISQVGGFKLELELAKKHFPDPDAIKRDLLSREIKVSELVVEG